MARARMSWKWKLVLSFILGFLVLMVLALTPFGHSMAKNWIRDAYNNLPESERRDSAYADWWMRLAYWAGFIRGDVKEGMDMYLEFCGAKTDTKGRDFTVTLKLNGLCSEDGKIGWGPFHKRAAEAYFNYLEIVEVEKTKYFYDAELMRMQRLFYQWCPHYGEKKFNPCFKFYWNQLLSRNLQKRMDWAPDIERTIPMAPNSPPDC